MGDFANLNRNNTPKQGAIQAVRLGIFLYSIDQLVNTDIKNYTKFSQHLNVRLGSSLFPVGIATLNNTKGCCNLFLRQSTLFTHILQIFAKYLIHIYIIFQNHTKYLEARYFV